jgi:hypothetical protein
MKRPDFLTGLSAGGYSLTVLADQLRPAPAPPCADELRHELDRLSPAGARRAPLPRSLT